MGTLDGMSARLAVIAGGPAAGALMPPLACVLCHAWTRFFTVCAGSQEAVVFLGSPMSLEEKKT